MIVLHEVEIDAGLSLRRLVVDLRKEAAMIAEFLRR